jgi:transcriptional regulator with XRE-family HTH domain
MREIPLGNKNIVGANIAGMRKQRHIKQKELVARMQAMGVDINPSSYSKLESQRRTVSRERF